MSDDPTPQKRCSKCGETKPIEMFSKRKHSKDGKRSHCKVCVAEDSKRYRTENADLVRERGRAYDRANAEAISKRKRLYHEAHPEIRRNYQLANKQKIKEYRRNYYQVNKDRFHENRKAYYANHIEEILAQKRAYHKAHAEVIRERSRLWRQNNPEWYRAQLHAWRALNSDAVCLYSHKRRALIKINGGTFTLSERRAMEIAQGGLCAYCERLEKLTIDHIIPIKQGGRHDAANICLACARCNNSKNNRTPEQWINRWYLRED